MNYFELIFSFICASVFCVSSSQAEETKCAFQSVPRVLLNEPTKFLETFVEKESPLFWGATVPESEALKTFRDSIRTKFNVDAFRLLLNQKQNPILSKSDLNNIDLAYSRRAGIVRPMDCLEGLLLGILADRAIFQGTTLYGRPTEFLAYVMRKNDELKVYFYTVDQPGIGTTPTFVTTSLRVGTS